MLVGVKVICLMWWLVFDGICLIKLVCVSWFSIVIIVVFLMLIFCVSFDCDKGFFVLVMKVIVI